MILAEDLAMNDVTFSKDINVLKENICWVVFRFPDSSVKFLRTTLREDVLDGVEPEDNSLYDLDRQRWFNLNRVAGSQIEIYTSIPELSEVDLFANKFIV
jgi:hypothetical protein